jgi:hypothetical protein
MWCPYVALPDTGTLHLSGYLAEPDARPALGHDSLAPNASLSLCCKLHHLPKLSPTPLQRHFALENHVPTDIPMPNCILYVGAMGSDTDRGGRGRVRMPR